MYQESRKQRLERIMTSVARGCYTPSSRDVAKRLLEALNRVRLLEQRIRNTDAEQERKKIALGQ